MRAPLEYGDNFPVPSGLWNPAVPWRFPSHEIVPRKPGLLSFMIPWLTLGLGLTLGVLWMSRHADPGVARVERPGSSEAAGAAPSGAPAPESKGIAPAPKAAWTRSALG